MKLVKEFFLKKRMVVDCDHNDIQEYIDLYNGSINIFESVYCYNTEISNDTVIVDKIFLDFDYDEDHIFFENAKKVASFLMENNIKFCIRFSGRGFHIFPFISTSERITYYSSAIKNYVSNLHNINNTSSDNAVVGDLRRLRRVLHTINPKSGLYCIPLSYNDLQTKTYDEIKKYAQKDRGYKDIVYNQELISLAEYDTYSMSTDVDFKYDTNEYSIDMSDDFPPCIQYFLSNPQLGYKERTDLIIYLRDMGYSYDGIADVLEEHLSPEKFYHSMVEEKQIENIMKRDMLLMRSCKTLKTFGLCPSTECQGNDLYL